jgi:hypothetical protein
MKCWIEFTINRWISCPSTTFANTPDATTATLRPGAGTGFAAYLHPIHMPRVPLAHRGRLRTSSTLRVSAARSSFRYCHGLRTRGHRHEATEAGAEFSTRFFRLQASLCSGNANFRTSISKDREEQR